MAEVSASSDHAVKSVVIAVCRSISVTDPKVFVGFGRDKVAVELRFSVDQRDVGGFDNWRAVGGIPARRVSSGCRPAKSGIVRRQQRTCRTARVAPA